MSRWREVRHELIKTKRERHVDLLAGTRAMSKNVLNNKVLAGGDASFVSMLIGRSAMRVLTNEELSLVSGGEAYAEYSSTNNGFPSNYGISSGPTTEMSGAVGAGLSTVGTVVPGPIGTGMIVAGGVISTLSALGYTTPQSVINAGFIEYGISAGESYGGQYGGSTFGNDTADPNGPGANSSFG